MNWRMRERLAAGFDLEKLTPEFYADPYPTYRALRENEPVKRLPNGSGFLTRYDDLVTAYKSTKAFSSDKKREFSPKYGDSPALRAPHHQPRLQRSARPHPRAAADHGRAVAARIAAWSRDLIALVDRCSMALAERQGRPDRGFAAAIPIEVIGNLLDVPHDERDPLRDWSLAILGALEPVIGAEVFARGNRR